MKIKSFFLITTLLAIGSAACGNPEKEPEKQAEKTPDSSSDTPSAKEANHEDGICEDSERAISTYCDGKDIVIRHADRACSKDGYTTFETVSCLKYEQVIQEAAGFSYNQKGICSEAAGAPTCILDKEYHCPETATRHEKCHEGYKISYWSFASCGDTAVEKDSPDCLTDSE